MEEELKLVKEELDAKCAKVCQLKVELSKLALVEEVLKTGSCQTLYWNQVLIQCVLFPMAGVVD